MQGKKRKSDVSGRFFLFWSFRLALPIELLKAEMTER